MARFLFFLRFARRHRRQRATLHLLRSAQRHLALALTPTSPGQKAKALNRLLPTLHVPLDAGGYDEHGLLTVEQIDSLDDQVREFVSTETHFKEEAAQLHRMVSREMIPAAVEALART